tara:strand:- start:6678 stop:7931 length:1254 start_codon:yes stop_codon:yes gene_type:complete
MSETVIKVSNLSKRYRLGLKDKQSETLIGQIGNVIKSPWQNLKQLRAMSKFGLEDESVFWALKNIDFEVKEGEVLGIIGKNGAGKSTLLKILSQITEATSGKIEIHGRVASLLEVGTGFHPELSGRENIYMNGTILGMTRREIDSKLDEIIDFSGVDKFIDTPVKFYSSGMKVRLGFSVAAHLEPEILIIDEVLAVGDFEFQKKCLGKMEDVSKNDGKTVLFVSHDLGAISNLCTSGLLLENGGGRYFSSIGNTINQYSSQKRIGTGGVDNVHFDGPLAKSFKLVSVLVNKISPFDQEIILNRNESVQFETKFFTEERTAVKVILTIYKEGIKLFSCFDCMNHEEAKYEINSLYSFNLNFLHQGYYSVALGIHAKNDDWSWNDSIFSFEILEDYTLNIDRRKFGLFDIQKLAKCERK